MTTTLPLEATPMTTPRSSPHHHQKPFPSIDLVPKQETNVWDFLKDHPTYNGSNVVIGILDTGIDPGATGLGGEIVSPLSSSNDTENKEGGTESSWTRPKLIDLVDCTGSGDVDMSI